MVAVNERSGVIAQPEVRPFGEVRRGYTYFVEGDVLFAKVTPCMQNGKHAIARNLIGGFGFGTTEFHVLRPGPEIIAEWIHRFLRQPVILQEATMHFVSAVGLRRVPQKFLETLEIPLPPLSEQKRIAAILNAQMAAVDKARDAAEAQLEAANTLPAAYLRAVFNSPEAQKWRWARLEDVCKVVSKGTTPTTYGYQFTTTGVPFLRAEDVNGGPIDVGAVTYISPETHEFLHRSQLCSEDILITIAGTLGRVGYIPDGASPINCNQAVAFARPIPELIDARFVCFALRSPAIITPLIQLKAGGSIQNLNLSQVRSLQIPLLPLAEQKHIASILNKQMVAVEKMRQALEEQLDAINKLPGALLRRAFSGTR